LREVLAEIREDGSGFGFALDANGSGENLGEGGAEVTGGNVTTGETSGDATADLVCGTCLGIAAGAEVAEIGIAGNASHMALAPSLKVNAQRDKALRTGKTLGGAPPGGKARPSVAVAMATAMAGLVGRVWGGCRSGHAGLR
jgi:hypothetical protein